ncbi:ParB family chromosome partitioning protein [Pararhizobium capsulatum DSM 1112]|uniref:ParB family chromosome partitioning protein n=1 Tax=Pararhizobium capsulatum DSM 1112 TaxID=1121113 RepID=A0ABU0BV61_9HYPH|nr:plasmid partitioning protein RepB [Pararhizobium capsulatum]MDQ0322123.1 ParB family chromosome partitioning protein [Pararhizobium capsulatum DSM 1112]
MSRKDRLKNIFDEAVEELAAANSEEERRDPAGPVRTMALTLGRMEEETNALKQAIRAGEQVVDLDPKTIDASFIRDRMGEDAIEPDDELVRSIAEGGQEVPILVRVHPSKPNRYQVAYGHRRLQAAQLLGRPVKAIIRPLEDRELVVAQGIENSARQNLSYIERALFAYALEERGFERPIVMQALSTDKTELSKMISVVRQIPHRLVHSIGNAPSIGRRRWLALAELVPSRPNSSLESVVTAPSFKTATSDTRFELVFAYLTDKASKKNTATRWTADGSGRIAADIRSGGRSYTLAFKAEDATSFGAFVAEKLDTLYTEFKQKQSGD